MEMRNIGNVSIGKQQAIIDALPSGEESLAVARASRWMESTHFWGFPTLILTNRRLVVSKDRLMGKAKEDSVVSLLEVESSGSGAVSKFGTWAIRFSTRTGQEYGLFFAETEHALAFEEAFREAVQHAQAVGDLTAPGSV
jgi:hypothetical protein